MSTHNIGTQLPTEQTNKQPLIRPLYVVLGVLGILLMTALFIWGIVWLAQSHAQSVEAVRDIFIIFLALESCLFGVAFIILLIMVIRLVNMLEFEIKPLLEKTNETVGTIRGTTKFVSENVVQPVTKARVQAAGVTRALKVLFGNPNKNLDD